MEIDGKTYNRDLILVPGKVLHPWIRRRGHHLAMEDLELILAEPPRILIVGTGIFGRMQVGSGLIHALEDRGVTCRVLRTHDAAAAYNEAREDGSDCAGAFHLTC